MTEVEKLQAEIERLKAKLDKKPTLREMYVYPVIFAMVLFSIGAFMGTAWVLLLHKVL
jgi:hypothetical protein